MRERLNERTITETTLLYAAGASIMSGKKKSIEDAIGKVRKNGG